MEKARYVAGLGDPETAHFTEGEGFEPSSEA